MDSEIATSSQAHCRLCQRSIPAKVCARQSNCFIAEAYAGNENAKRMLAFAPMLGTLGKMIKIADVEERLKKVEAMVAAQQHGREEEGTEKNEQDTKKLDAGTGGDNEEDK